VYFEDPEGNVVEVWDFFERGEGRREGTGALSDEGAAADSSD
jgi:catechol-2,3-dioxygenase